jgi:hypothetical protein
MKKKKKPINESMPLVSLMYARMMKQEVNLLPISSAREMIGYHENHNTVSELNYTPLIYME